MAVEVGQLVSGQAVDTLFNLVLGYAQASQFGLYFLIVQHGLEFGAVDAQLLLGNGFTGADHGGLGLQAGHGGQHE